MTESEPIPAVQAHRLTGSEPFTSAGSALGFDVLSYWRWSGSNLLDNTTRGLLAEYLVAQAVGAADGFRVEWEAYDLTTQTGIKIEVKSAAYIQSWVQAKLSAIRFGIAPAQAPDLHARFVGARKRAADVYVFCLLAHKDPATVDPLNLDQWRFLVLATKTLEAQVQGQKTIGLRPLLQLGPREVDFQGLGQVIVAEANLSD